MNYDYTYAPPRPVDQVFRVNRRHAIDMKVCVKCGGEAEVFADYLSEREYTISALCQRCQDDAYAALEDRGNDIPEDAA